MPQLFSQTSFASNIVKPSISKLNHVTIAATDLITPNYISQLLSQLDYCLTLILIMCNQHIFFFNIERLDSLVDVELLLICVELKPESSSLICLKVAG